MLTPDGLGRNIGYAAQARQARFTDAALHPSAQQVGGPVADPAWDAFWGGMHDQEGVPMGQSLTMKSPSLNGLRLAMTRPSGR